MCQVKVWEFGVGSVGRRGRYRGLMAPGFYPSLLRDRPSQGVLSIRGYMMLLIAAILLPMLTLVAIVAWEYGTAARHTIEAQRLDVANNLRILIDREIDHTAGFLDGLSNAPGLRNGNAQVIDRVSTLARAAASRRSRPTTSRATRCSGSPEGSQAVPAESIGLAEIAVGHEVFVSNLIANAGEKPGLYFVSVPMIAEGQLVGVLTGGLPATAPAAAVRRVRVDAAHGLVGGHRRSHRHSAGAQQEPGEDRRPSGAAADVRFRARHDHARPLPDRRPRRHQREERLRAFGDARRGRVSIAVPTVIVDAPLWHNALTMTVIGVVLTLVSLLLAFMVASHLSRAIQRLGIAAVAIASGDVVRMPASNISELRDVSRSIEVTGAVARRNRRADLKSVS